MHSLGRGQGRVPTTFLSSIPWAVGPQKSEVDVHAYLPDVIIRKGHLRNPHFTKEPLPPKNKTNEKFNPVENQNREIPW